MCGRKTLTKNIADIIDEMNIECWEASDYKPNYNIAPTQQSTVLIQKKNKTTAKLMRWGIVPSWSKKPANTYKIFNARIETILEKPVFKNSMQKNRCVVLADGYYEWDQNTSQPYYLYHPKNQIIPMAGLWTKWNQTNSKSLFCYTVITAKPVEKISHIHNRMPAILSKNNIKNWLGYKNTNISNLLTKIQNHKPKLEFYPVSKLVNSINNNSSNCTKPMKLRKTINIFSNN